MAVTQKVTLYNNKFTVPPVINAVQNDTDRQIVATLGDFTLASGMTAKLSFERPDKTHYETTGTVNTTNNTVTAELDQALTQVGICKAQIKVTETDGLGSTFMFIIKVQPDVAGISVPQDGWSAQEFDQRLTDAENAIDAVEEDVANLQEKEYDYAPVITDTASGTIASFPDGADGYPLKSCVVDVDAVQDLHGYDNPWPAGGGKNKLPAEAKSQTSIRTKYTCDSDGVVVVQTTASGTGASTFYVNHVVLPAGTYKVNGVTGGGASTYYIDFVKGSESGTRIMYITDGDNTMTLSEETDVYVKTAVGQSGMPNVGDKVTIKPMIRLATESDATFAPYSNICPISGWSEAKVTRTGKNILQNDLPESTVSTTGWTILTDKNTGVMTVSGTGDGTNNPFFYLVGTLSTYPLLIKAGSYVLSQGAVLPLNCMLRITTSSTTIAQCQNVDSVAFTLANDTYVNVYLRLDKSASITTPVKIYPMIRLASDTDPTFAPYNGTTFTISLGDTRYGGTLDVTRGKLRVTKVDVDMGEQTWTLNSAGVFQISKSAFDLPMKTGTSAFLICSTYPTGTSTSQFACIFQTTNAVRVSDSAYASYTADQFKTAMSGQTICYELATPIEVDLTPVNITALLGTNNVWADTGDVEVEYCCSTRLFIEKKLAELA